MTSVPKILELVADNACGLLDTGTGHGLVKMFMAFAIDWFLHKLVCIGFMQVTEFSKGHKLVSVLIERLAEEQESNWIKAIVTHLVLIGEYWASAH